MGYTVSKSTCEMYEFKFHGDYAYVLIDESTGLFQVSSSYGTYGYSWPYHGRKTFKHFILEIVRDSHYLLGKVARADYFYEEETKEKWLKQICKDRYFSYDVELSKEEARELYDDIKEADFYSADRAVDFIYSNDIIAECYGSEPWYTFEPVIGYSPNALGFAKYILPMIEEVIEKELANPLITNGEAR